MNKLLVIAPHHDDAEFGLGGYMNRLMSEKVDEIEVVIFCGGNYRDRHGVTIRGDQRDEETHAAMQCIGGVPSRSMNYVAENYCDRQPRFDMVGYIDEILTNCGVGVTDLYIPLPSYNQDHTAIYDACITALRPGRWEHIERIWAYPYPGIAWGVQEPRWGRCYIKLTSADMRAKKAALLCHASQNMHGFGLNTAEGAIDWCRARGLECGAEYAEVIYMIREIY